MRLLFTIVLFFLFTVCEQSALAGDSKCKQAGFLDTPYGGCAGLMVTSPAIVGGGVKVTVSGTNVGAVAPGTVQFALYAQPAVAGGPQPHVLISVPGGLLGPTTGDSHPLANGESVNMGVVMPAGCDENWQGCQNTPAPDSDPFRKLTLMVAYQTVGDTPEQLTGLPFPVVEVETPDPDGRVITITRRFPHSGRASGGAIRRAVEPTPGAGKTR